MPGGSFLFKPKLLLLALAALLATVPTLAFAGDSSGVPKSYPFSGPSSLGGSGHVMCADLDGDGVHDRFSGGACVRFDQMPADADGFEVRVTTRAGWTGGIVPNPAVQPPTPRFLVCVDLNGDGVCGEPLPALGPANPRCADRLFSNVVESPDGTGEKALNPLPVPRRLVESELSPMCARHGGFPGYIVIVQGACSGVGACDVPVAGEILPVTGSGETGDDGSRPPGSAGKHIVTGVKKPD